MDKVLLLKAVKPVCVVLFAVGSGGNPELHLPLLQALVASGCTVVAPRFDRIMSPVPTAAELTARGEGLRSSLKVIDDPSLPVFGVGHSIGATLLVALSGGQMWTQSGQALPIAREVRLKKLVLFAPPTGFFQPPNALDAVEVPIQLWAGSLDTITPPSQVEYLKRSLSNRLPIDFRLAEGAGHFSFMNTLPPGVIDEMPSRVEFLNQLASDVSRFLLQ